MRIDHERNRTDEGSRERAVSDVVAFVLTFSIIITGVGLVSTGGFDQLTQFTNNQQVDNSERGMVAAAAATDNLQQNSDTYREFDLSLGGGTVWFNETNVTISSDEDIGLEALAPGGNETEQTIQTNALEHRFDLSSQVVNLAYEGGAVFRSDTASARYEPALRCEPGTSGDDRAVVSLLNLTTDESIDRSGAYASDIVINPTGVPSEAPVAADNQFISFSAERVDQTQVYASDHSGNITLDVSDSAYPEQWEQQFENSNWGADGSCDADTVLIRVTTVELSLLQRDPITP